MDCLEGDLTVRQVFAVILSKYPFESRFLNSNTPRRSEANGFWTSHPNVWNWQKCLDLCGGPCTVFLKTEQDGNRLFKKNATWVGRRVGLACSLLREGAKPRWNLSDCISDREGYSNNFLRTACTLANLEMVKLFREIRHREYATDCVPLHVSSVPLSTTTYVSQVIRLLILCECSCWWWPLVLMVVIVVWS